MQRAINEKAKTGLKSNIIVKNLDIRCLKGYHFSNNTVAKIQTQRTAIKDSYPKKAKGKENKTHLC